MSRWKAAAIHLLVSVVVAVAALILTLLIMYPWEYFVAGGGNKLLTILISVDVIIGPLLTLIVFKTGKPSLRFDLICIALVQIAALAYGLYIIVDARPVFLVHVGDRFHLVRANQFEPEQLTKARYPEFQSLSWTGPRPAVALLPTDVVQQSDLLTSALAGFDLDNYPETYEPYDQQYQRVVQSAQPISTLLDQFPEQRARVQRTLDRADLTADEALYLPLVIQSVFSTAIINAADGHLVDVLPFDPW